MRTAITATFGLFTIGALFLTWNGYPRGFKSVEGYPWHARCWQFRKQPYDRRDRRTMLTAALILAVCTFVSTGLTIGWESN